MVPFDKAGLDAALDAAREVFLRFLNDVTITFDMAEGACQHHDDLVHDWLYGLGPFDVSASDRV